MKEIREMVLTRTRKFMFFPLFLFCTVLCYGQRARLFSTDSELSNSLIQDIHQDHKGIIWIATEDGVNSYDGSKFTIYKEKEGVLFKNVRLIFEDSQNNLFFGFSEGLQIYHHASDSFETVPLILKSKSVFPGYVLSMVERQDGTLLIGTSGQGIFSISTDSIKTVAHQLPDLVPSSLVNLLFEDDDQNLWVSTQDKGLFRIEKGERLKNYFDPRNGLGSNIESICHDYEGNLFVGSLRKGLFKYNKKDDLFEPIPYQGFSPPPVKELYPLQTNKLLIGTDGEGMKLYDPEKNQISNLNFNISNFDFSKSKVHTIIEDNERNIWLGLFQKGVALIPSRINNFKYIGYQSVTSNIIGSNYIMSVYKDHEGVLWVGTDSDGLYKISPDGEQLAHYNPSEKSDSAPSTIMCIYEDSENNLWVGSYLKGLAKLNRSTGTFEYVTNMLNDQFTPVYRIYSLIEDGHKNLWIGTLGFGLYSMNLNSGEIKNYSSSPNQAHPDDATNTLHSNWIGSLLLSKDEKLFIGTADGISSFDLKTKTFTNLNNTYPVLSQGIETLHQDPSGRLWIGTGQGLFCLNPEPGLISRYTMDDGLPSDVICAIENDENQNLWISTNLGISKLNLRDTTFVNYFFQDGLQGNEFSKRAVFKGDDGEIFFGGINGITYFKPEEVKDNIKTLKVTVTGFYIHNVAVKKGMRSGKYEVVNTSVRDANTFQLSHEDNSFTVEFSAMEFVNPQRISYLYSVNDSDWISLQQGTNTVSFNNLSPGEYSFKVKAHDFSTYSDIKEINIIIHPAWYFSIWAKVGYFLISILVLMGVVLHIRQRMETKKQMREHLHAEQINDAKLEFFTNISHEIRTPLSLILNPLKKLIASDIDTNPQHAYKVMRRNTERILHLINQLMDLRKIDSGKITLKFSKTDIIKFIRETTEIFEEQILAKHIRFQIHYIPGLPHVWIDRNYFDKPIQNLLSNAIKFTPENGDIHLSIEIHKMTGDDPQTKPHLKIICTDSGVGLNESEIDKIFDRFYQAENGQNNTGGTGIGLHLTRSIVELHQGTICAENNPDGRGCRFIIRLPLGNAHLDISEIETDHIETENFQNGKTILPPLHLEDNQDTTVKSKNKKRVLIVDDDEEVRKYICAELASCYHMHECVNGKEALFFILKNTPDLVISDVVMPEMDGITLCQKIKQNVNINHIPVILLTAKSKERDNLKGLGIGADAYIVKPFNIEIVKETVQNIIRNRDILRNSYRGSQLQNDKVKNVTMKSPNEKLLKKVIDIVNENIGNPELNVEMLSREIGISRVHLHRKLKELTNQSTRDFVRNIRLQQAAKLLSDKPMNISEVAFALGFTNIAHFSNAFKDFYGEPPKTYMETHRKHQENS